MRSVWWRQNNQKKNKKQKNDKEKLISNREKLKAIKHKKLQTSMLGKQKKKLIVIRVQAKHWAWNFITMYKYF